MRADTNTERELAAIDDALEGRPVDPDLTELAALARSLRDDRMEIDPFFARELDAKTAAGFPRSGGESRWRSLLTLRSPAFAGAMASVLLAVVVSVTLLSNRAPVASRDSASSSPNELSSGLASSSGGSGATAAATSAPATQKSAARAKRSPVIAADEAAPVVKSGGSGSSGGSTSQAASGAISPSPSVPPAPGGSPKADPKRARKVETSASLTLTTKPDQVQTVSDKVVEVTDRQGGFVNSSSVDVNASGGTAAFQLRIPSARLKQALADLSRLAGVRERSEATQDITPEFVSARDRLANARAERAGLLRQLSRAVTDADRARIKAQLRIVSSRIAAAKTDLARVDNRASFSTIAVAIVGDPAAAITTGGGDWSPGDAAKDALRVLEVAAGVALVALAIAVPLGLLAGMGVALTRLTTRRRRERLLDAI